VASRSDRLFPTMAGPAVMESRVHCRLDRAVHFLGLRRRGARGGAGAAGGVGEVEQVGTFGFVELEDAGDGVEHAGRDPAE
jgi:hypothetical protein